jgi:precorrin-3B C17-methyltransferase
MECEFLNKIYIVGIGPGAYEEMTIRAAAVLKECEVIVGYTVYTKLLEQYFPGKEYKTTPMRQEITRCRTAFEEALKGRKTAVVCSGDAGIYGMAGLMYELSGEYPQVELEVVPGVTAGLSGAALLGAPLGHDCCFISLSDLLTPWEVIENRLRRAAQADFALVLYNPSSRKRRDYLKKACEILLEFKSKDTICGIAKNIGREGESLKIITLGELRKIETDMFSTIFIGNKETKESFGKMVTPRGYKLGTG